MGLIRSGNTDLTPEGDYIPFTWKDDFAPEYLKEIKYCCLIMSQQYIEDNFNQIKEHANAAEARLDDSWCTQDFLLESNAHNLEMCQKHGCNYILIDGEYEVDKGCL